MSILARYLYITKTSPPLLGEEIGGVSSDFIFHIYISRPPPDLPLIGGGSLVPA
jgi:hypothetical protein